MRKNDKPCIKHFTRKIKNATNFVSDVADQKQRTIISIKYL